MILTNGRVVFSDGIRAGLELTIDDGKIADIGVTKGAQRADVLDLAGNYVAPGFVDLHVHGALGRDTMEGTLDAFRTICNYHASGGTTSLLLTTATAPLPRILEVLRAARAARETSRSSPACTSRGHSFRASVPARNAPSSSVIRSPARSISCWNSRMW